jgi:ribosomal protein S18 acetylase RimI-like enzyme
MHSSSTVAHPPSIIYRQGIDLDPEAVADLFRAAELNGPLDDLERMRTMLANSQLIISAWDGSRLVGLARTLTDFAFNRLIADLAVHPEYQRRGIGKELIRRTLATSECVKYVVHAAATSDGYYPHVGFDPAHNCWVAMRKR